VADSGCANLVRSDLVITSKKSVQPMIQLIIKVLAIGAVSTILAFVVHGSFIRQLNSGELILKADIEKIPSTAGKSGGEKQQAPSVRKISLAEAKERFDTKSGTFIDARLYPLYEDGHVAGAISFPVKDYEKNKSLEKIADLKDKKIIIYCSGKDCPDSGNLAAYLAKEGFVDIEIFEGGWPEWKEAGYPSETTP
jgi:rhodanese-related sulfurtransferase